MQQKKSARNMIKYYESDLLIIEILKDEKLLNDEYVKEIVDQFLDIDSLKEKIIHISFTESLNSPNDQCWASIVKRNFSIG